MKVHIALIRVSDCEIRPTKVVVLDDIPEDIQRELEARAGITPPSHYPFTSPTRRFP